LIRAWVQTLDHEFEINASKDERAHAESGASSPAVGRCERGVAMSSRGIRIVPKTKDPMTPFVELSRQRKWHLRAAFARDPAARTAGEITYWVPDRNTIVNLRDDVITGVHYFTIDGPHEAEVAEEIRSVIESYTEPELLAWWDRGAASNDIDDKVDAVLFLGVGTPATPTDDYLNRIRAALADPDKDVRNAAIVASGYADWPVFKPDLERIADSDPDETARQRAAVVVAGWKTR